MNNMYEYLLNKNTAMQKQASALMLPACSKNVYNVLRKVAAEDAGNATASGDSKDPGYWEKVKQQAKETYELASKKAEEAWNWTKAHGEDLGYIGGGLGLGAAAGALATPKNRILGALLGAGLGGGAGYGTKLLVDKYGPTVKDKVSALFKKDKKSRK